MKYIMLSISFILSYGCHAQACQEAYTSIEQMLQKINELSIINDSIETSKDKEIAYIEKLNPKKTSTSLPRKVIQAIDHPTDNSRLIVVSPNNFKKCHTIVFKNYYIKCADEDKQQKSDSDLSWPKYIEILSRAHKEAKINY
jgi:hypothetical protein